MSGDEMVAFWKARLDEDEAWFGDKYAADDPVAEDLCLRLLREVAANRSLLTCFEEIGQPPDPSDSPQDRALRMAMTEVVRMLILDRVRVYSDHPDYLADWKP